MHAEILLARLPRKSSRGAASKLEPLSKADAIFFFASRRCSLNAQHPHKTTEPPKTLMIRKSKRIFAWPGKLRDSHDIPWLPILQMLGTR